MTTLDPKHVAFRETQAAYLRGLLFEELHKAAEAVAELAADAAEGGKDCIAGDNAYAALNYRLLVVAELLDTVGWSVLGDTDRVIKLERAGQKGGA